MAGAGLIEAYLSELRFSAGKLRDIDDVLAEVEDHLRTSADVAQRTGEMSPADAEAYAVARFGSPELVARVFKEEAKRGGAVSTSVTRRAGLAAIAAPIVGIVGEVGNENIDRGALHGVAVGLVLASFVAFVVALWGVRQRHGGLGGWGRVGFWLFVSAPFVSVPFGWGAGFVLALVTMFVVMVLGVGMLRARVLPASAVVLFTLVPLPVAAVVGWIHPDGMASVVAGGLACAAGLEWIGWILWREPALDVRAGRVRPGPLATA